MRICAESWILYTRKALAVFGSRYGGEIVEWLRGPTFSYCAKSIYNCYVIVGFFE